MVKPISIFLIGPKPSSTSNPGWMDSGVSFTCDGDQGETRFFLHLILSCFQTLIFQALITAIFTVKSTLINQRITGINGKNSSPRFWWRISSCCYYDTSKNSKFLLRRKMYHAIFNIQWDTERKRMNLTFAREPATLGSSQSLNISLPVPRSSCRSWLFRLDEEVGLKNVFKQMF